MPLSLSPSAMESDRSLLFVGRTEGDGAFFVADEYLPLVSCQCQLIGSDQMVKLVVAGVMANLFV